MNLFGTVCCARTALHDALNNRRQPYISQKAVPSSVLASRSRLDSDRTRARRFSIASDAPCQSMNASASVNPSTQIFWRAFAETMAQDRLTEFARTLRQEVHLWAMQHKIFDACLQSRLHI